MLQYLYLVLCVLGTILPYSQFIPFLAERGLDIPRFVQDLFASRVSAFFGLDVIVSSLALWAFVFGEGKRQRMRHLWVYVLCNLVVGVSLALPLFLYIRERHMTSQADS